MKNTAIAIAMMTLILIGTAVAQPKRRVAGSTAMGGGSGVGVKNRQANLGDTGTHEVGHKGRRPNARRTISKVETARPKGLTLPAEDYPQEHYKNPSSNQQGARKAVPAPTPSPVAIRKGKPKSTNFSWGVSQTGSMSRTTPPRRR